MISNKEIALKEGKNVISVEPGNSMTPLIKSRQPVLLIPIKLEEVQINDIVYCKVHGKYYTHLVKSIDEKRGCLIGNNHGGTNDWTRQIFGKVSKIYPMKMTKICNKMNEHKIDR